MKANDPAAIAKIVRARDETYASRLVDSMETFMPTVRKLRPERPWAEVAEAVTRATDRPWTVERLYRSVRRLVAGRQAELDRDLRCAFVQKGPRCSKPLN